MKLAHIINPVKVTKKSDLYIAQPITFETMRRAKNNITNSNLEVELAYACYEEDLNMAPDGFIQTSLLTHSVLDIGKFNKKRKLPLIKEILDRLYEVSDADYFIYTNVDIALMPDFYDSVAKIIEDGYDGFVINRRTISNELSSVEQIEQMYMDKGEKHPGYDCFVFRRDVYERFSLDTACIGANWIGRVLISNVIAYSKSFKVFEDEHLTFHIGDDRSWKIQEYSDFDKHNEKILIDLLIKLLQEGKTVDKPLLSLFIKDHHVNDYMQEKIRNSNKITLNLKENENLIYGDKFKPSWAWDEPTLLRQDPIFVIGYPRSGTTLLQSLLATQDNIITLPETHFFTLVRDSLTVENGRIPYKVLDKVIDTIRNKIRFSTNAESHIRQLSKENQLSPKMLFEIVVADNLIDKVDDLGELRERMWLEKTPDHVLKIDIINNFYPNAKFIFVLRSPEQAILSRRKNFSNEANLNIKIHAKRWIESVEALEVFHAKHKDNVKIIKLEDLVADKEKCVAELCDFIGIRFNSEKISEHNKVAAEMVLPWEHWKKDVMKSKVSQKIANNQKELNKYDLISFLDITKEKLEKYGYMSDRYKIALEEYAKKRNQPSITDALVFAFEELASYSVFKNPIKKYRAYKNMIATFHAIKAKDD